MNKSIFLAFAALAATLALPRDAGAFARRLPATGCYTGGDYAADYITGMEVRPPPGLPGYSPPISQNGLQTGVPMGGTNIGNQAGYNRTRQLICPIMTDSSLPVGNISFMQIEGSDRANDKSLSALGCVAQTLGIVGDACGTFSYTSNGSGGSTNDNPGWNFGGFWLRINNWAFQQQGFGAGYAYVLVHLPSTSSGQYLWMTGLYWDDRP